MTNIDKNIPAPISRYAKYPFSKMEVGDSVFFAGEGHGSNCVHAAKRYFKRSNKKMTSRKEDGGIRIWRLE